MTRSRNQGVVIVGAGPGGLAPLFAAACRGELQDLLHDGVTILERGFEVGAGALGQYAITSDSTAAAILDIITRGKEPSLVALQSHPTVQALATYGDGAVPLHLVGRFLKLTGEVLCRAVAASPKGHVLLGGKAHGLQRTRDGHWRTYYSDAKGRAHTVRSCSVVLATGAHQPVERLHTEAVAGAPLLPLYDGKVIQSGFALTPAGLVEMERRLSRLRSPRVAVVGGSTSAAAVAVALLTRVPNVHFGPESIALLHRRPLRLFYETAGEALRDGYNEFSETDVCPLTGRVFRMGGFRLDSRELIMGARGLAGRPAEPRLRLLDLREENAGDAASCLAEADLIVAALGYRPRLLPVHDADMQRISLLTPNAARWAVVDQRCRVLTAERHPLPGLFAMGLAVGPEASRELGGEADFHGQVNSLWLWQHTLGDRIARQIHESAELERTALKPHPAQLRNALDLPTGASCTLDRRPSMAGAA